MIFLWRLLLFFFFFSLAGKRVPRCIQNAREMVAEDPQVILNIRPDIPFFMGGNFRAFRANFEAFRAFDTRSLSPFDGEKSLLRVSPCPFFIFF